MKKIIENIILGLIFFNILPVVAQHTTPKIHTSIAGYHTPNMYSTGSQIERITQAIQDAQNSTGRVIIPAYDVVSESKTWLIDQAILLPSNIELILDNCTIKLSDQCRDNFIRSANVGLGITDIKLLQHIRIHGIGNVVLEGADNPRSTGDHNKTLSADPNNNYKLSYGSDAGKTGENQRGGWRNHGIILAHVENFQISGITLKDYHGHGIVLERAQHGKITDVTFDVRQAVTVNGQNKQILNQDGLGVRFGCKNIIIDHCSGKSGDDFINIGLTDTKVCAGQENVNVVSGSIYRGEVDNISNIYLQNWQDFYSLSHRAIRIMPVGKLRISNIFIDNMIIHPRSHQGLVAEYAENIQGLFVCNLVTNHPIISNGIRYASFRNILYHGQGKAIDVVPTENVRIDHVFILAKRIGEFRKKIAK